MATSAFKSTTKRDSIGGATSGDSRRRSRSLSRMSRPLAREPDAEPDYNKDAPRGKFVNTTRGSTEPFPEISLDDLALEFFSSSSKNESDGGVSERKGREGRSVSRHAEIGRWASGTASSRRRERSVSRARGDVVSSNSASRAKKVVSHDGASRRRRSLSVARYQISDSESEGDPSWSSSNHANVKAPISSNNPILLSQKATASSNRRLGRSRSQRDLSLSHGAYSISQSPSSALTDDESRGTHFEKNGFEKIIRTVYAQKKAEHPSDDVADGGFYEAMRKELRYAVQEIRTELNQAIGRNQAALSSRKHLQSENAEALQDYSGISDKYAAKSDQRSVEGESISKKLSEEAERCIEDFISGIEDTDISSFDGYRSDGSTLGGIIKAQDSAVEMSGTCKIPPPTSCLVEMDGVILPWLQWETTQYGTLSEKNMAQTPITPKSLQWDSVKEIAPLHDQSSLTISSHGSWSPCPSNPPADKGQDACRTRQVGNDCTTYFDMEDCLKLRSNDELLFEMYRERNRINSGGLLLCTGPL